jgi:hypothetical protein
MRSKTEREGRGTFARVVILICFRFNRNLITEAVWLTQDAWRMHDQAGDNQNQQSRKLVQILIHIYYQHGSVLNDSYELRK